jgi:hypothetical protein
MIAMTVFIAGHIPVKSYVLKQLCSASSTAMTILAGFPSPLFDHVPGGTARDHEKLSMLRARFRKLSLLIAG